jgi:transposase-like protein
MIWSGYRVHLMEGEMEGDVVECGSAAVSERRNHTAQGSPRFRCRTCGKQFNERNSSRYLTMRSRNIMCRRVSSSCMQIAVLR